MRLPGEVVVIDPMHLLSGVKRSSSSDMEVADLIGAIARLQKGGEVLHRPPAGEAFVMRLATYSGTQLVGGYTLVVGP